MDEFSIEEVQQAPRALLSLLGKCEKIDGRKLGASQRTLLERRISALRIALSLITREIEALEERSTDFS